MIEEVCRFLAQPSGNTGLRILEILTPKLVLFSLCQAASPAFIIFIEL